MNRIIEYIRQFNAKLDRLATSKQMSRIRITGSVIWNLILIFLIFTTTAAIFIGGLGLGYFASLVKDDPLMTKAEMRDQIYNYDETSEIYFAGDIYIGKLRTDLERRETSIAKVSPTLINAVLATEDEYFNEHDGIVPKAVLRGLFQDITNSSTQTGGSTLTQQLIKNQILTNEVSYERKAREILLALRVEKFMTKQEIIEAYLNIIPYGRNASGKNIAGVETAAQGIFGISASELNLAQAAYIAGIPQAPFAHTPFTNKGEIKDAEGLKPGIERMETVLKRMLAVGYITQPEYEQAVKYDITKDFREPEPEATDNYPWLTYELEDRAKEIIARVLAEKDGIDPKRLDEEENLEEKYMILADRDVRSGGYRIYSTIDKGMYDAMQEAAQNFQGYGHTFTKTEIDEETGEEIVTEEPVQVGSIAIENNTGRILSFVGGRKFDLEQQFNYATRAFRPNGSTMKPLLVYAPAIEYGVIGAGSPVVDVKFTRGFDGYSPTNYLENQELGIIPAREALAKSQNLPALRLYDSILDKKPAGYLEKMGFSQVTPGDYENLSAAIGGLTYGTTVEENTNAFTTFANGGQFIDAYMIDRIEDLDGNIIYKHEVEPVKVFSPETSYMVTDMLRDVLDQGTATRANSALKFSSDFAAKTGTTNDFKDVWLVGYNPNISLGVWLGYENNKSLAQFNNTYGQPSTRVNLLWASLMNSLYDVNPELVDPAGQFERPANVVNASFCGISGDAPSTACSQAGLVRSDLFNRNVFLPSKVDSSLNASTSVMIDGKAYIALDSTPREFVITGGSGINAEFASRILGRLGGDPSKLWPGGTSNVVSSAKFNADGSPPQAVTASHQGNAMTWSKSASNDVIGYRVYDITNGSRTLVSTLRDGSGRQSTITSGRSYIVVAVDITGRESANSNTITTAVETPTEPVQPPENNNADPNNGNGETDGGSDDGSNGEGNSSEDGNDNPNGNDEGSGNNGNGNGNGNDNENNNGGENGNNPGNGAGQTPPTDETDQ
ncbi:transglycosylase domain-containing protein [Ureibacillus aquaedulcis]|uniref:Transglycosylase domain-containing protein n=1 Tax=Ureibacillus aquaedulcis TaxID=3058421 RepID=A0ABT8GQL7_9BACL|nr:transglycosylase domain-containing protein [Ureibacillus sp. BA0131]MDN4493698.1 transglycosylase domain-containing protein [Ureibacillus sp. BA0131]